MLRHHHVYCVHTSLELAEVIDHFSYFLIRSCISRLSNLSQTQYTHTKEALEHDHDATECFLHLH